MIGKKVKDKVIATIVKYYEIGDFEDVVKVPRVDFKDLSDAEISSTLKSLVKKEMIELLDTRAISTDAFSIMYKYNTMTSRNGIVTLEIKILPKFKKHISDNPIKEIETNEVLYTIEYKGRKLKLNNIIIANPRFDSENDLFAEYIVANSNKKITSVEFEKFINTKQHKKFDQIITDLNFKGKIKKLFFPNISNKAVEFRNPITKKMLNDEGFDYMLPKDLN